MNTLACACGVGNGLATRVTLNRMLQRRRRVLHGLRLLLISFVYCTSYVTVVWLRLKWYILCINV
jgi:hypothetical protein